jgi:hypothetical protein
LEPKVKRTTWRSQSQLIGGSSGYFGSGIGVGFGFNFGGDSRQFESTLEILMGRGAKPADPNTYDAQQVLNRPM